MKQIEYLKEELIRLFNLESIYDKINLLIKNHNECDYLIIKHNDFDKTIIVKNYMANNVKYHKDLCNVFNSYILNLNININDIDFNNKEITKKLSNFDFNNTTVIGTAYEVLSFLEENIK